MEKMDSRATSKREGDARVPPWAAVGSEPWHT